MEGTDFQSKLDLISGDDVNSKMSTVLNHLVVVFGLVSTIPALVVGARASTPVGKGTAIAATICGGVVNLGNANQWKYMQMSGFEGLGGVVRGLRA